MINIKKRISAFLACAVMATAVLPAAAIVNDNDKIEQLSSMEHYASLDNNEYTWSEFRGNNTNNGVTDKKTPKNADDTVLYWASKGGDGIDSDAAGSLIIVDNCLVFCSGTKLCKMNRFTGELLPQQGEMAAKSSFNIVSPLYADGKIFVSLSGGIVQAFDAKTLESLWIYQDPFQGQPNCQLAYNNGYVYTGFWNSESESLANFVCLSAADEDPNEVDEVKSAEWTYTQEAGFYWAGAYVCDSFLLIGTEDGKDGSSSKTSCLLSIDPLSGNVIDKIENLNGDIRSSVVYDDATDRYYFTSKGGSFYSVAVNGDGTFKKDENGVQGYDLKEIVLHNADMSSPSMSTSTPVIYNGRAYIGVSGSSQFSIYSGHCIAVLDLFAWEIAYTIPTKGYPQTSGLLTNAYEDEDGYVYVYFIDNYTPGQVRVIKDKQGVTSVVDGVTESYKYRGKTVEVQGCAPVLFTPSGEQAQYAICSPIADEYGTLYFKNDSAYIMAVGSKITDIEVIKQPDKVIYKENESFDPTGMQLTAHLANGLERDITEYVEVSDAPLTLYDTDVTVYYNKVMYGDKFDAENGNTVGVEVIAPETYVNIKVADDEAWEKIQNVMDKIAAIGEVTVESESAIVQAREAYDELDDTLKAGVSNYSVLIDAESKLEQLKQNLLESSSFEDGSSSDESSKLESVSESSESVVDSSSSKADSIAVISTSSTGSNDTNTDNVSDSPNTGENNDYICILMCSMILLGLFALVLYKNDDKLNKKK